MSNTITIRRSQLGRLGSFIGGLGLLVGVVGVVWQAGFTPFIVGSLLVGALGMGLWVGMTPQEARNVFTGRQMRQSTLAILSTLLMIGIVALVYILVQRQVIVADVTIDQRFTLTDTSLNVIDAVRRNTRDVEILSFYYPYEVVRREIDDQYYQLYTSASQGAIRRNYVDPLEQPALAEQYMDFISAGISTFVAFINEDGTVDRATTIPVNSRGTQERDMTEALSRLMAQGQFKIYFERSLGTPDPVDNTYQGMSLINNLARENGLVTEPLSLTDLVEARQRIPSDASALVLARPRQQLSVDAVALIEDYMNRGGALFIAADAFFRENTFLAADSLFNRYLWENFGVRMADYVVVDPASSARSPLELISAVVYGGNRIVDSINREGEPDSVTLFNVARGVQVDDEPPVTNGRLIETTPEAWGETDLAQLAADNSFDFDPQADVAGPLTTAAWAQNQATGAQVVLVGDGDFLLNAQVTAPGGNALFFLDAVGWMTGFTQAVRFEPRGFLTSPLMFVSTEQLDLIAFGTVIFMPALMLVAAGSIWARRRRHT